MSSTPSPTPRRLRKASAVLATLALGGGMGIVAANADFNDVPDEAAYGEHVENVSNAGIATGFNDGSFRPGSPLTRSQAAAWLGRSGGRVGFDWHLAAGPGPGTAAIQQAAAEAAAIRGEAPREVGSVGGALTPANPTRTIATVTVDSGAVSAGSGFLVLDGEVMAAAQNDTGAGCPCAMDLSILDEDGHNVGLGVLTVPGPAEDDERTGNGPTDSAALTGIVPIDGGDSKTFTLVVTLIDSDVEAVMVLGGLTATYAPFGPDGGNSLD